MFTNSRRIQHISYIFFFNDTSTTEIYTLSLHDALPISLLVAMRFLDHRAVERRRQLRKLAVAIVHPDRSEEHTSELQSRLHLVCRLLLEKKKKKIYIILSM